MLVLKSSLMRNLLLLLFVIIFVISNVDCRCNSIFRTSQRYSGGALGGLNGADLKCQTLAQNSPLTAVSENYDAYRSFLSSHYTDLIDRLPNNTCFERVSGEMVVATTLDFFTPNQNVLQPVSVMENGTVVYGTGSCWTGTLPSGYARAGFSYYQCGKVWQDYGGDGSVGSCDEDSSPNSIFNAYAVGSCLGQYSRPFLCFEEYQPTPLPSLSPTSQPTKSPTPLPSPSPSASPTPPPSPSPTETLSPTPSPTTTTTSTLVKTDVTTLTQPPTTSSTSSTATTATTRLDDDDAAAAAETTPINWIILLVIALIYLACIALISCIFVCRSRREKAEQPRRRSRSSSAAALAASSLSRTSCTSRTAATGAAMAEGTVYMRRSLAHSAGGGGGGGELSGSLRRSSRRRSAKLGASFASPMSPLTHQQSLYGDLRLMNESTNALYEDLRLRAESGDTIYLQPPGPPSHYRELLSKRASNATDGSSSSVLASNFPYGNLQLGSLQTTDYSDLKQQQQQQQINQYY